MYGAVCCMRNWESKHNCKSPETDATKVSSFPIFRIPLVPRIKLSNKPTALRCSGAEGGRGKHPLMIDEFLLCT